MISEFDLVWLPALSFIKCVTLGKICNFFEPQVRQVWNKTTINITYLTELIKDLSRVHDIKEVHINVAVTYFHCRYHNHKQNSPLPKLAENTSTVISNGKKRPLCQYQSWLLSFFPIPSSCLIILTCWRQGLLGVCIVCSVGDNEGSKHNPHHGKQDLKAVYQVC